MMYGGGFNTQVDGGQQQLRLPVEQGYLPSAFQCQPPFSSNSRNQESIDYTYPSPRNNKQALMQQLVEHAEQMVVSHDQLITRDQIKFLEQIGEGRYGTIMLGVIKNNTPLQQKYQQHLLQQNIQKKKNKFKIAVKQLHGHVQHDVHAVVGFKDEVKLLTQLNHPSIIRCFGAGTYEPMNQHPPGQLSLAHASAISSKTFLVMEYAKGGTLSQLILKQMQQPTFKLYTYAQSVRWTRQIAEGLAYLHGNDHLVIHRDISASNILLTNKNLKKANIKLADFGLYRVVHDGFHWLQAAGSIDSSFITEDSSSNKNSNQKGIRTCLSGHTYHLSGKTGNPLYMAPEVWLNQPYNEKVDIFALGCIMFELYTGQLRVFDHMTHDVNYNSLLAQANQMSAGIRPKFPENMPHEIQHLISQCWHQDQARRPSAAQVVEFMREIESQICDSGSDSRGKKSACVIQ